ncbi:hypothetical protein GT360_10125 [Vibrio astriarenae]|uniref:Uncharacterized protein n=1 Tax=Vibrio astriarenae TaxID=1481923 RepID=A0A7Z2T3S8_9VIBR|nr:hypothetical protein [Vibrio astriarenae]QIA63853.1 hypothetical protein GT360_10125 [Vibrio astriarenae]
MKEYVAIGSRMILAVAIGYLGYSIIHFTQKVEDLALKYPHVIEDVERVTQELKIEQWLALTQSFESMLPEIINTVDNVNSTVSEVQASIASVDAKIPAILTQVEQLQNESLPLALDEMKEYRVGTIPSVVDEMQAYRKDVIPDVQQESESLRRDVPVILAQAETIVDKSQELTAQAATGAVKGVVLTPFSLINDAKEGVTERVRAVGDSPDK